MRLTSRQAEVLAGTLRITTDGATHNPLYRLDGRNVSAQVRTLLSQRLIKLEAGRLSFVGEAERQIPPAKVDTARVIADMRKLLDPGSGSPSV